MNVREALLDGAKRRARKDEIPFALKLSDIVIPDLCPILGIPLVKGSGRWTANSPSLDRYVASLGYIPSNIAVISLQANILKRDATLRELVLLARWMKCQQSNRDRTRGRVFLRGQRWWVAYYICGREYRLSSKSTQREDAEKLLSRLLGRVLKEPAQ